MSIKNHFLAALSAVAFVGFASCEPAFPQAQIQNVVSYTLYAAGPCDSRQYIPGFIGSKTNWFSSPGSSIDAAQNTSGVPMPNADLWIISAALNVVYTGEADQSYSMAMSGISNGLGGDYLIPKFSGSDTRSITFPQGTGMLLKYGDISSLHIDMHVWCVAPLQSWQGTLTIYTIPVQ